MTGLISSGNSVYYDVNHGLSWFTMCYSVAEMVATIEEIENANVPLTKRDYCAHMYIKWKKCHQEKWPWGKARCKHEAHEYSECQLDE